jgi:hypothetical protein
MNTPPAVIVLAAAVLAGGCSRAKVVTEIKPDGSYVRTVSLTGKEKKEGLQIPGLEDTFVLPSGDGWMSREEKKADDRTMIFERKFVAGAAAKGNLSLKGGKPGEIILSSEASVSSAAPGRFEYREVVRWMAKPDKDFGKLKPEDLAEIKAALPKALATDDNAQAVAKRAAALILPMFFGPGDTFLALGMMHPDLAERRITSRIGGALVQALEVQFGAKLTAAERRAVAERLVRVQMSSSKPSTPDPAAGPPSGNAAALTPLIFVLRAPGKVVSSNGERDDFTGEVYWAMYPEAATLQDLTLTAVCEAGR